MRRRRLGERYTRIFIQPGGIECYRSVETVKAKVIALYAVVLSNANHRRQNVRRVVCGLDGAVLKAVPRLSISPRLLLLLWHSSSRASSRTRLLSSNARSSDSCETIAAASPALHSKSCASPFATKRRNSPQPSTLNIPASLLARRNVDLDQSEKKTNDLLSHRVSFACVVQSFVKTVTSLPVNDFTFQFRRGNFSSLLFFS